MDPPRVPASPTPKPSPMRKPPLPSPSPSRPGSAPAGNGAAVGEELYSKILSTDRGEFDSIAAGVNLDADTKDLAWTMFSDLVRHPREVDESFFSAPSVLASLGNTPQRGTPARSGGEHIPSFHDHRVPWMVACMFIAGHKKGLRTVGGGVVNGTSVTITQLVREANIEEKRFFETLRSLFAVKRINAPVNFEKKIRSLEAKFVIGQAMKTKYLSVFDNVFPAPTSSTTLEDKTKISFLDALKRFGWLLFVWSKDSMLAGHETDMMQNYQLLMASVHFMVLHAGKYSRLSGKEEKSIVGLSRLCKLSVADLESKEGALHKFLYEKESFRKITSPSVLGNNGGQDFYVWDGLMERFLDAAVAELRQLYDMVYLTKADFDERLYIESHGVAVPGTPATPKKTGSTPQYIPRSSARNLSARFDAAVRERSSTVPTQLLPSPLHPSNATVRTENASFQPWMSPAPAARGSPARGGGAMDVVDAALECTEWLNSTLGSATTPLPDCASEKLLGYFALFSKNPKDTFVELMEKYLSKVPTSSDAQDHRRTLIAKLYVHVLERLMESEEKRQKGLPDATEEKARAALTNMISSDTFHKAVVGCAAEVVQYSQRVVFSVESPAALDWFSLTAWDLFKVITYFVLHMPNGTPRPIRRHLQSVEHRLVSEHMWKSSDTLVQVLQVAGNKNAFKRFLQSFSGTAEAGSEQDETIQKTPHTSLLKSFAQKVLHLASVRIFELCHRLSCTHLMQHTYTLFKYCLEERRELVMNRDMDVIIMCSLYGLGRVHNESSLTFKRITEAYKLQPQYRPLRPQFRGIRGARESDDPVDIIKFYNNVYVPLVKSHITNYSASQASAQETNEGGQSDGPSRMPVTQLNNVGAGHVAMLARMPQFMSPKRVGSTGNVYMSPVRSSGGNAATPSNNAHMTPRTRTLYAFGESPRGSDFARINNTINSEPKSNASKRQLLFNPEAEQNQKKQRSKYLMKAYSNLKGKKDSGGESEANSTGGETPTSPNQPTN